jgi:hypothetical protein
VFTNPIDITARRKTDELLGESYKVVKEVRDNLATIKSVYLEKDKITSYAESLQALVQALKDKRDGLFIGHDMGTVGEEDLEVTFTGDNPISAITRNLEAIDAVKDSIDAINSINNHLKDIKATALCLEDILDCNENKNSVLAVASVIENVKKLGEVSDNLVSLIKNMDTVINVSNNLNSLQAISKGISAVEQVNAAFSVINNLNDSLVAIKAVSAKTESIDVVATVADKLNLICEALTDIETVAQMKETLVKISKLDGFENVADVSALSNQVTKNTNDIATLTNTTIPALREQIGSGSIPENLSTTISEHTTKISKLETDVASLKENGTGSGTEVDLSNYALKTELTKTNSNVSKNTNALTGLTKRVVALEENGGSGSGTSVDLSDYAKKSDVNTLKGDVTITAGKTDLAGLDSRITTLESSASSGSGSSDSGDSEKPSGNSDIGGWFPFHDPRGYGRSSGVRHEYNKPESFEWEAPADCWIVIEGKGGGTANKDSSIYATVSYGVDQHFCGSGTQSGGNVYVYGSAFMCKGSKLKVNISNMNWIYLAHTAVYKDEGARPASDTPTEP